MDAQNFRRRSYPGTTQRDVESDLLSDTIGGSVLKSSSDFYMKNTRLKQLGPSGFSLLMEWKW